MVNIYSKVWDLRNTNYCEMEEELKEELLQGFTDYCKDNDINYVWVGKGKIEVIEDTEDLKEEFEDEIKDELEAVYEDFIGGF